MVERTFLIFDRLRKVSLIRLPGERVVIRNLKGVYHGNLLQLIRLMCISGHKCITEKLRPLDNNMN